MCIVLTGSILGTVRSSQDILLIVPCIASTDGVILQFAPASWALAPVVVVGAVFLRIAFWGQAMRAIRKRRRMRAARNGARRDFDRLSRAYRWAVTRQLRGNRRKS